VIYSRVSGQCYQAIPSTYTIHVPYTALTFNTVINPTWVSWYSEMNSGSDEKMPWSDDIGQ